MKNPQDFQSVSNSRQVKIETGRKGSAPSSNSEIKATSFVERFRLAFGQRPSQGMTISQNDPRDAISGQVSLSGRLSKKDNLSSQDAILDMIDNEINYLERQIDFSYLIKMQNGEVSISMVYIGKMPSYPSAIEFCFGRLKTGEQYVRIGSKKYAYSPHSIQNYVNRVASH